jgi:hypothetical protein
MSKLACLACACTSPDKQTTIITFFFLGGFAINLVKVVGLAITGIAIDSQAGIGTAVSIASSLRSTISTVASAISTAILTDRLKAPVLEEVSPKRTAVGLPPSPVILLLLAITGRTLEAFGKFQGLKVSIEAVNVRVYNVAISDAYQTIFYSLIAFSAVCVSLALLTPNQEKQMTEGHGNAAPAQE